MLLKMVIWILDRQFAAGLDSDDDRRKLTLLTSWLDRNLSCEKAGLNFMSYREYLAYVFGGPK